MSEDGSRFDASSSALGYFYQVRFALLLALRKGDDPDLTLSIEKLDDVTFQVGTPSLQNAVEALQFKHHISRAGGLGDSSLDIWKTIRNWSEGVLHRKLDPAATSLFMVTTSIPASETAACFLVPDATQRDPAEALRRLIIAGTASADPTVKACYAQFSELGQRKQRQLIDSVYLLHSSPSITELDEPLLKEVRYAVRPQYREALLTRLEGWWYQTVVKHLALPNTSVISVSSIQRQVHDLQETFRRDSLPDDMLLAPVPPEAVPAQDERMFVRQLELIGLSAKRLRTAQEDHYRAFAQRSRWVKEQMLGLTEVHIYESKLVDGWQVRFDVMVESITSACSEPEHSARGAELYTWIETEAPGRSELWVRSDFKSSYMIRGSYHMLADELRLGWHPLYSVRCGADGTC